MKFKETDHRVYVCISDNFSFVGMVDDRHIVQIQHSIERVSRTLITIEY